MSDFVTLPRDSNQALGLANYALDFMSDDPARRGHPAADVLERTNQFHTDACICGLSALALGTNAPHVLRDEALTYPVAPAGFGSLGANLGNAVKSGATVFGSHTPVHPEKAVAANSSAVREWDSNGTNFGFNPSLGHTAGEFGHNDFYPVAVAAAQLGALDGEKTLRGMVLIDEIRGRLAEVFSLKSYNVDHVVHGAIASAATFGAMLGAEPEEIESAIGMVVAHAIPFRAIRAGKQLSDSKGASAAISSEFGVLCMKRSMRGFRGPRDIFRNPEAIFRLFEGPSQRFMRTNAVADPARLEAADASPFDLVLAKSGSDFAVMGMHFKLGLYEHQSAGAIQAMVNLLSDNPQLLDDPGGARISGIQIVAYQPAFGIIGDPAKRDPRTRQSADHSMVYIVATLLRKALEQRTGDWKELMLEPRDYASHAIFHPVTRRLMDRISFAHGGPEYDNLYPDGIPTSLIITDDSGQSYDSGLVMYPVGHARNTTSDLKDYLNYKFRLLGKLVADNPDPLIARLSDIEQKSADEIRDLHNFEFRVTSNFE